MTVPAVVPPVTVYTSVNVPEVPAATVAAVHGEAGNPVQVQPAGGVIETNVVFAGVASLNVPLVMTEDPVFVTTCVYVMLFPAGTGFGEAMFVTDRFGPDPPTMVVTVAVLFERTGSVTDELTEAMPVITVPFVVPGATFTTNVNGDGVAAARFT
jgi:hypothetical protein